MRSAATKKRNRRELQFRTASENKRDKFEHNGSFQGMDTTPESILQDGIEEDPAIDRPPAIRKGREVDRMNSILDDIAAEDADKARKCCLKLLRGMLGEGGLRAFLRCPQPAHDDMTGGQMLVRDPLGLLASLEQLEGGEG